MTKDENKEIEHIDYNHLNLPTRVTMAQGDIIYVYDASGVKLEKHVTDGENPTVLTKYAGNYIYENDELQFFNHAEGYSLLDTGGKNPNTFRYVYQYKDHLGNVRLSYNDINGDGHISQLEIIEESNYYPFGLKHKGYNNVTSANGNSVAQKFEFNGQEFEEALGLNITEMDFRQYDPAIGRFISIDPLTEVVPTINPYQFSFNNPIFLSDPSGLIPEETSLDDFLQDVWDRTPNDGYAYTYDGNGNLTGVTDPEDPEEIAIAESQYANGITNTQSKEKRAYFKKIDQEYTYLRRRGMREQADFLQNLIVNGNLNAQEIAEVAQLRTTLVKKLKALYMCAIYSPDIVAEILFMGLGSGSSGLRNKSFNYIARGESYAAIGATAKIGERALKLLGGKSQVAFRTSTGMRYVDQLVNGVAMESKVGYTSLTKSISRQIAKDKYLISRGQIKGSTWHFFRSPVTGKLGASKPLLNALKDAGIKVIIH